MKYSIILIIFFNCYQNFIYKEKIVGDEKNYNLKVIFKIDKRKKTEEINFKHIINQKLCFRFKNKDLRYKNFNVSYSDGYVLSGIEIQKYKNHFFYNVELYKSNGSPEIFVIYDINGVLIAQMKTSKTKTEYKFFKKGFDSTFFDETKTLNVYDLTDLLL